MRGETMKNIRETIMKNISNKELSPIRSFVVGELSKIVPDIEAGRKATQAFNKRPSITTGARMEEQRERVELLIQNCVESLMDRYNELFKEILTTTEYNQIVEEELKKLLCE